MKNVMFLLFFGFFDLTKAVDSAQTLQQRLNDWNFNCNVRPANDTHLNVRCNLVNAYALRWVFQLLEDKNINELKLENLYREGRWKLNQLPWFKCEVLKFVNGGFSSIEDYAFVNVEGLTKLYFKNVPLKTLPFFGHLPWLKTLGFIKVPLQQLTNHASKLAFHQNFYGKRTFAGLTSLQTLILRDTNIYQIAPLDIYDLPNLVTIQPQILAPIGFVNHQEPNSVLAEIIER
uniref:Leucine-rich repeat domain-containing protein n=1 Tax=Panagrellus redivivus TaxID=6233 RepID=A0A7E4UNY5_PANRE